MTEKVVDLRLVVGEHCRELCRRIRDEESIKEVDGREEVV